MKECKHKWQQKGIYQESSYNSGSLSGLIPSWVMFLWCGKCLKLRKIYAVVEA